jgi:hypothetical protein
MKKIIALICILPCLFLLGCKEADHSLDQFAQCLTDKGAKMYGEFNCPHCIDQKEMFKDSFSKIKYIECHPRGENSQYLLCIQKEIKGVPMWEFQDGAIMEGPQKLETLSEKTDCPLPKIEPTAE